MTALLVSDHHCCEPGGRQDKQEMISLFAKMILPVCSSTLATSGIMGMA
jgi:hypothetical protein